MSRSVVSESPPRILFPDSGTGIGGSLVSTAVMARELRRQGLAVPLVVTPRAGDASRLSREYGLLYRHLGLGPASAQSLRGTQRIWNKALALPAAAEVILKGARLLRDFQPNIIHTNDDQAILLWGLLAQVFGTPVVATDCPFGPGELVSDGETGLLVPVEDPEALAQAITYVLSNPDHAAAMSARARQFVQGFDLAHVTQQYSTVLEAAAQ